MLGLLKNLFKYEQSMLNELDWAESKTLSSSSELLNVFHLLKMKYISSFRVSAFHFIYNFFFFVMYYIYVLMLDKNDPV